MLQTLSTPFQVNFDSFDFVKGIQVVSGSPIQNVNLDTAEYEPDRSVTPCTIKPWLEVINDPEGIMWGAQAVTAAAYYLGAPKADESNRIVSGDDFVINADLSLTVKRNFGYSSPMDINCRFEVVDKRKNVALTYDAVETFYTTVFDSQRLAVKIDQPVAWSINPLTEVANADGEWLHTITAQLYSNTKPVDAANAAYWWQICNLDDGDTTYRDITDDELEVFITGRKADGTWGRSLTFDARFFRSCSFRCSAAYYTGTRPSAPTSSLLTADTTVKVELPKSIKFSNPIQYKGFKIAANLKTPVGFRIDGSYNNGAIPDDKLELFRPSWYVKSTKTGSTERWIRDGFSVELTPADLGMDVNYPINIYAKIKCYNCYGIVVDNMTDQNAIVLSDDSLVVVPIFD